MKEKDLGLSTRIDDKILVDVDKTVNQQYVVVNCIYVLLLKIV